MKRKKKLVRTSKPLSERNLLHRFVSSRPYLTVALVLGVATGLFFQDQTWLRQALIGWNVTVWGYMLAVIPAMNRADHHRVRAVAARQDESAGLVLATMTIGIALTMAAVISELAAGGKGGDGDQAIHYIATAVTVVGSWLLLGVLYCFHYAHKYYNSKGKEPELKFPDDEKEPDYWDFLEPVGDLLPVQPGHCRAGDQYCSGADEQLSWCSPGRGFSGARCKIKAYFFVTQEENYANQYQHRQDHPT
jgi:uncharacterized membrane protein